MRLVYRHGSRLHEVEVSAVGGGRYRVAVDGMTLELALEPAAGGLDLVGADGATRAWVTRDGNRRFVSARGLGDVVLERVEGSSRARADAELGDIVSPMPGKVVKVLIRPGDEVEKGAPLVVVEAMKTELTLVAPRAGRVVKVTVAPGVLCEAGKPLVELG